MDFILGDMHVGIEVKGTPRIHEGHARGLKALMEEHTVKRAIIVSLEKEPKSLGPSLEVLPWELFLKALWSGELL